MDRLEYQDLLDSEVKRDIKPLSFNLDRLQVKTTSNTDHLKKTALAAEISQAYGKSIPRIRKLIK